VIRARCVGLVVCVVLLGVGACASGGSAPPAKPAPAASSSQPQAAAPVAGAPAAPAGGAAPAWQQQWDEVVAKARQEGRVVFAAPAEVANEYRAGMRWFTEQYGIEVETRTPSGSDVPQIILRECSVNRQTMDVVQGGMGEAFEVYPKGCLAPVKPLLIHPEVADPANWRNGYIKFNDPEGQYFFEMGQYVSGVLIYNTERLRPEDLRTSRDLLRPELKGKIATHDPRVAGAGRGAATYYLEVLGPEFIRQLYFGQDVARTNDHRQLAEWVARGVHLVGIGAVERGVEPLRREGLPLGVTMLSDVPGYLSGGSTVVKAIKNPPHPNAQIVLLNWLASREGQRLMMEALGQPTRRVDVEIPANEVPAYRLPQEGVTYDVDDYDFTFYTEHRPEAVRTLLQILGR
jgi:ABC-type Fe3+ transport system substrate-binding protein